MRIQRGTAASPEQLIILRQALNEHCREFGIDAHNPVRENIATRILLLFSSGISDVEQLKAGLREDRYM